MKPSSSTPRWPNRRSKPSGPPKSVRTEAKLEAEIDPEGLPTSFQIEYGTDTSYGQSSPEKTVGSRQSHPRRRRALTGLTPATTYHYRFIATNSLGTTEGPDRTFVTYANAAPDTSCPNQQFRVGFSADLPDCRAYEMVSPVDKNGGDILATFNASGSDTALDQSQPSGAKLTYTAARAFGDAPSGPTPASTWPSAALPVGPPTPSLHPAGSSLASTVTEFLNNEFAAFSADLSNAFLSARHRPRPRPRCRPRRTQPLSPQQRHRKL